jgi:hypothetical protein
MNERIRALAHEAGLPTYNPEGIPTKLEKFAELIVRECADICMEMSAKCAGLEGDGALAKDCAYWIQKDFGVEE